MPFGADVSICALQLISLCFSSQSSEQRDTPALTSCSPGTAEVPPCCQIPRTLSWRYRNVSPCPPPPPLCTSIVVNRYCGVQAGWSACMCVRQTPTIENTHFSRTSSPVRWVSGDSDLNESFRSSLFLFLALAWQSCSASLRQVYLSVHLTVKVISGDSDLHRW